MTELFSSTNMACESPRSRWMRVNGVTLTDRGAPGCDELGDYERWLAEGLGRKAEGPTADEALSAWAVKTKTRFWNEDTESVRAAIQNPMGIHMQTEQDLAKPTTLVILKAAYPILRPLGEGWHLIAHPNGPAIARSDSWQYMGHLSGFQIGVTDLVPASVRHAAIDALMEWAANQPAWPKKET